MVENILGNVDGESFSIDSIYPLFLDTYSSPCVVSLCFDERISGIWINVQGLLLFFFLTCKGENFRRMFLLNLFEKNLTFLHFFNACLLASFFSFFFFSLN